MNTDSKVKVRLPDKAVKVRYDSLKDFYKKWCTFLRPIIKLTNREIDIVASFLEIREEYSKSITDQGMLDKIIMSEETRRRVMKECGITSQYFCCVMSKLRENGVIIDKAINPLLIPNIKEESRSFYLGIIFEKVSQ